MDSQEFSTKEPPLLFACLLLIASLAGCAASPSSIKPLTAADNDYLISEREIKLHRLSELTHEDLVRKGMLYRDPVSLRYLNEIGTSLVPPAAAGSAHFNFFILKDASVNAFAMPNGNIYLNIGLLSKLENEAELAFVLSHEIAHVIERHSYQGRLNRHNTVVAAHVADLLLFGTGLAYIPAGFGLATHSREQEQEADLHALGYMSASDYALSPSIGLFEKLVVLKHPDRGPSIWASHPDSEARSGFVRTQIAERYAENSNTSLYTAEYESFRRRIAELAVRVRLLNRQYELAEDAINAEISIQGDAPQWRYYLGEVYRGKSQNPEAAAREHGWLYEKPVDKSLIQQFVSQASDNLQRATENFKRALALDPDYGKARKGLGLTAYQRGELSVAKHYLTEYIHSSEQIKDRLYIDNILRKINLEGEIDARQETARAADGAFDQDAR